VKPQNLVGIFAKAPFFATQALAFITGGTMVMHPDAVQLLGIQCKKFQQSADPSLPQIDKFVTDKDTGYCRMELLEGPTLREAMTAGPVAISLLLELVRIMQRLSENPNFEYHGDLKPENIIITASGLKIIDPGHFGPLDCREGHLGRCIITTPAYYPLLIPDDLFALGIILWEIACRRHPLDGTSFSGAIDKTS